MPEAERMPGDHSVWFRVEFAKLRNYIDFLRALAGGVALLGIADGLDPTFSALPDAPEATAQLVSFVPLALLLLGVLIQTFRFEGRTRLFPPIFYFSGLSFAFGGVYVGAFALILIWAVNLVLPSPLAFLSLYALLVAVFGCVFDGFGLTPLFGAFLIFLPVLLSLLMRRPLVLFTKKVKPSGPVSSA